MPFSKILIISDNIYLCEQFKEILMSKDTGRNISTRFSTSPFSDHKVFSDKLNEEILTYDLRNDSVISEIIDNYDLVISVHCKQIFPRKLVKSIRCINVHPGYNPINRGWYPQVFAIINDLPIGATIHEIDEELDHGKIIARSLVEKDIIDTSETLYNKVIAVELQLIKENIKNIVDDVYSTIEPETNGNIFLKKDFNKLCELNLNEKLTTLEFLNKLRALTHGDFNNAYFISPGNGKKVYVNISLKYE